MLYIIIEKLLSILPQSREVYNLLRKGAQILFREGWISLKLNYQARNLQKKTDEEYLLWIIKNEPSTQDILHQKENSKNFMYTPCISIITPVYNPPLEVLKNTINSVLEQTYTNWELCIVDGNSENAEINIILKEYSESDKRIKIKMLDKNHGISGNSNIAISFSTGEFISFLDHDDVIAPFALFEIVKVLNENKKLDFIYSDRDHISGDGKKRFNPFFKPDWSPELLLSANYITHLSVVRKNIIDSIGGFCEDVDGAQDWDLFFRISEKTQSIFHIPKVLYHWRDIPTSCSVDSVLAKPYIVGAQRNAIDRHLKRCGLYAQVDRRDPGVWHISWTFPFEKFVSIIIPSKNITNLKKCINSLVSTTRYNAYEVIVIFSGLGQFSESEILENRKNYKKIKVVNYSGTFNYSLMNNIGARHARGDLFLFLNDNINIISSDWLEEMVGWSIQDKVGVVGAKLMRSDKTIQHAGIIIGLNGLADYPFAGNMEHTMGIFGSADWYRNYLAVAGECMMVRRDIFNEVGNFDENFSLYGSDIEYCLRVYNKGYRIIFNPFAKLKYLEPITRKYSIPESDYQRAYQHYKIFIERGDPFYNKNLSDWSKTPKNKRIERENNQ